MPDARAEDLERLVGRFHSHLTVRTDDLDGFRVACAALGCKPTIIDLARGDRSQRDVMATRHHVDDAPGAVGRIRAVLTGLARDLGARGHPVIRVKIEHESLPSLPSFDRARYHEVHIKLSIAEAELQAALASLRGHPELVPSRNPRECRDGWVHQFLNARIHEGDRADADARVQGWCAELVARGLSVVEVKRETVVLDDAPSHDAWWL